MNDERFKKIMADLGMPDNRSLLQALWQVANEVAQAELAKERERCAMLCEYYAQEWGEVMQPAAAYALNKVADQIRAGESIPNN